MEWISKSGRIFDEKFQVKLNNLFDELYNLYPDKNVKYLKRDHENLSKKVRKIRQEAGYNDNFDFCEDFGFTYFQMQAGEEPVVSMEIKTWKSLSGVCFTEYEENKLNKFLSEILAKYPNMEIIKFCDCRSLKEKAKYFTSLKGYENYSVFFEDFGFKYIDSRFEKKTNEISIDDLILEIRNNHPEPFEKTSDIKQYQLFRKYCTENDLNTKKFLVEKGLLSKSNISDEEITTIIEKIKKEHPTPYNYVSQVMYLDSINKYCKAKGILPSEFLFEKGILEIEEDSDKRRLNKTINNIKSIMSQKYKCLTEIPDIDIIRKYCIKNNLITKDYLVKNEILMSFEEKGNKFNNIFDMPIKKNISIDFLIALNQIKVNSIQYDKAIDYIDGVYDIEYNNNIVTCKCEGSSDSIYNITLQLDEINHIKSTCDCPQHNEHNRNCKHIYRLVLILKHEFLEELKLIKNYFHEDQTNTNDYELPVNFELKLSREYTFPNYQDGEEAAEVYLNTNFDERKKYNKIIIPEGYKTIRGGAFSGLSNLTTVILPSTIEIIEESAFYKCVNLKNIVLPNNVKEIGDRAFMYCESISNIKLPEPLTVIGESVFNGCTALESIAIPKNIERIERFAFFGCENLKSIIVDPENVTYDSRENCNAVIDSSTNELILGCINTIIPISVESIGVEAFVDCFNITIPDNVKSINSNAFWNCKSLNSIYISKSVKKIEADSISGAKLISISVNSENTMYDSRENCNAIIETASNKLICGCKNTIIPNNVTTIGEKAFYGSSINSLIIPSSIKDIGKYAFSCSSISSLIVPGSVETIDEGAFKMTSLSNVLIEDGVKEIGDYAFWGCRNLNNIEIADSIIRFGDCAFGMTGLTNFKIPSNITKLSKRIFWHCKNLRNIEFSNNIISIGEFAFAFCGSLIDIEIPDSVKEIEEGAFYYCNNLISIKFSNAMTVLNKEIVGYCEKLNRVILPNGLITINDKAFDYCSNLVCITFPDSLIELSKNAFESCSLLKTIIYKGEANNRFPNFLEPQKIENNKY